MKVGFIGLGIMGRPMAKNMVKAGVDLVVTDLNKEAVADVVAAGATDGSYAEIGATCDVVFVIVPSAGETFGCLFLSSETCGLLLITLDTVDTDNPDNLATSDIVANLSSPNSFPLISFCKYRIYLPLQIVKPKIDNVTNFVIQHKNRRYILLDFHKKLGQVLNPPRPNFSFVYYTLFVFLLLSFVFL